eukprot:m.1118133 g.1118133  ORF g.1118133 m.1118133 type:complete len:160 (-) comp24382_c1_seq3:4086-4565(-)
MDLLSSYFDAPEGVSLVADNGKYLSRINQGNRNAIAAAKDVKDPFTCFRVSRVADTNRVIFQADNNSYVSLISRGDVYYLEAAKSQIDSWCEFEAYDVENKLVLKGFNGKFVSRIFRQDSGSMEAAKEGVDTFCMLTPHIGSIISPHFEILGVSWDAGK